MTPSTGTGLLPKESPRLVKIRVEAGVIAPEFIYLDLLEAGVL